MLRSQTAAGPDPEALAHTAIVEDRMELDEQRADLDERQHALEADQSAIEADAQVLEEQIRLLAKQEAEIQQRKRALQHEARAIGQRRTQVMKRAKGMAKERGQLEHKVQALEKRQAELLEQDAHQAGQQTQQASPPEAQPVSPAPPVATPGTGAERRVAKRVPVAVDVSFHTEHNFYMGLTENLSSGGLFVATYDDIPVGTQLKISLRLPDQSPIEASCAVRWVRQYTPFTEDLAPGVGLELTDLSERDERAIQAFLVQRDPIYYELD